MANDPAAFLETLAENLNIFVQDVTDYHAIEKYVKQMIVVDPFGGDECEEKIVDEVKTIKQKEELGMRDMDIPKIYHYYMVQNAKPPETARQLLECALVLKLLYI